MKLLITIPDEFEEHFRTDRFEDSLHRLSADAHLLAGNYEQETAKMLRDVFKNAEEIVPCKDCEYWQTDWGDDEPYHYCPIVDLMTPPDGFYCTGE